MLLLRVQWIGVCLRWDDDIRRCDPEGVTPRCIFELPPIPVSRSIAFMNKSHCSLDFSALTPIPLMRSKRLARDRAREGSRRSSRVQMVPRLCSMTARTCRSARRLNRPHVEFLESRSGWLFVKVLRVEAAT